MVTPLVFWFSVGSERVKVYNSSCLTERLVLDCWTFTYGSQTVMPSFPFFYFRYCRNTSWQAPLLNVCYIIPVQKTIEERRLKTSLTTRAIFSIA